MKISDFKPAAKKVAAKPELTPRPYVKAPKPEHAGLPVHGVWGILLLIAAASVMYANYRVFFGVEELIPRLMLAPSTLAVTVFLVVKAAK